MTHNQTKFIPDLGNSLIWFY